MTVICMRFTYCLHYLLIVNLCVSGFNAGAQHRPADPFGQISLIAGGGIAYYMGDISADLGSDDLGLGPVFTLGAAYRLSEHLSARGELRLYRLSGDSKNTSHPEKNLSFTTLNPDLAVALQADLLPFTRRARVNPYGLLGVGVTFLTPKAVYNGTTYSLAPLHTEGKKYGRLPLVLSGGIGALVRITNRWSAGVEISGNYLLSDYLDDVSTVYPSRDMLESDLALELAYRGAFDQQPGYIRGNPKSKDSYILLTAKVHYALPDRGYAKDRKQMKCP